jgi:hypothetical protein
MIGPQKMQNKNEEKREFMSFVDDCFTHHLIVLNDDLVKYYVLATRLEMSPI